jgi:hypothetical protein
MTTKLPKYRRPLNTHQLAILNTLYKFRFTTASLLADNQQANHTRVISNRLKILVDQGYVGMNYGSSYKIQGRPATYYLATDGVKYLRLQLYTQESALRSIYQDKRAQESQIHHRLNVFKTYVAIKRQYPDRFKFYSKTEVMNKPYIPKTRPDAYLVDTKADRSYFLDYLEDNMSFWTLRKAIKRYIGFAELELWQKHKPEQPHPKVLFVCESEKLKRKVATMVNRELDASFSDISIHVLFDVAALPIGVSSV